MRRFLLGPALLLLIVLWVAFVIWWVTPGPQPAIPTPTIRVLPTLIPPPTLEAIAAGPATTKTPTPRELILTTPTSTRVPPTVTPTVTPVPPTETPRPERSPVQRG